MSVSIFLALLLATSVLGMPPQSSVLSTTPATTALAEVPSMAQTEDGQTENKQISGEDSKADHLRDDDDDAFITVEDVNDIEPISTLDQTTKEIHDKVIEITTLEVFTEEYHDVSKCPAESQIQTSSEDDSQHHDSLTKILVEEEEIITTQETPVDQFTRVFLTKAKINNLINNLKNISVTDEKKIHESAFHIIEAFFDYLKDLVIKVMEILPTDLYDETNVQNDSNHTLKFPSVARI